MSAQLLEAPAAPDDEIMPIMVLGYNQKRQFATRKLFPHGELKITAPLIASYLALVLDAWVDKIPEKHQIEFEKSVIELFKPMVEARHEYIGPNSEA